MIFLSKFTKKSLTSKLIKHLTTNENDSIEIVKSNSHDSNLNLAIEEYLYQEENLKHPTLFLWTDDKAVVIGNFIYNSSK